jgi:hypothetical protein
VVRNAVVRNAVAALPILWVLLASAQVVPPAHLHGRIAGILLYPNGTPVPKGRVVAIGARPHENPDEVSSETDQDGRFEFRHLRFTSYWFSPSKEDEAYGDGKAVSVRGGVRLADPTGVKLTPAAPTAHVVLKLGPKWGILRGTVEDRTTHKPVVALLGFAEELGRGGSNEPHYLHGFFKRDAPGAFRILIPPALDLFLQVNADGYKPWFYPDGLGTVVFLENHRVQQPLPLRLESGEQKSLKIELEVETKDQPNGAHP